MDNRQEAHAPQFSAYFEGIAVISKPPSSQHVSLCTFHLYNTPHLSPFPLPPRRFTDMKTRALFALAVVLITLVQSIGHLYRTDSLGTLMPLSRLSYTINQYRPPDISDAEKLHLSAEQCIDRYPDLYYEADRAREYFKGGISEEMVDAAEKDEANARVAIIDNKVGLANTGGRASCMG